MRKGLFFALSLMIIGCSVHKEVTHIYYVKKMTCDVSEAGLKSDDDLRHYDIVMTYQNHCVKEESKQDINNYCFSYTKPEEAACYLLDFDLNDADIHVLFDHDVIMKYPRIEKYIGQNAFSYQYDINKGQIAKVKGSDELGSFTHEYAYDQKGHVKSIKRFYEHGEADFIHLKWRHDHIIEMKDEDDDVTYSYTGDHLVNNSNHMAYSYKGNHLVSLKQKKADDYEVKYSYKTLNMKQEVFDNKELLETYRYEYMKIK